ncbi:MAG: hypothetical protein H8E15_04225 [Planctomycetes bacterium]|nr:hypothetical protein [Planctomycetota bacterium]
MNRSDAQNPFLLLLKQAERKRWCTSSTCRGCGSHHLADEIKLVQSELGKRLSRRELLKAFREPQIKPWEFGWLLACGSHLLSKHQKAKLHARATRLAIKSFDPELINALLDRIPADWPLLSRILSMAIGEDFSGYRKTIEVSRQARIDSEEE